MFKYVINYFPKKTPSKMFDSVLSKPLPKHWKKDRRRRYFPDAYLGPC